MADTPKQIEKNFSKKNMKDLDSGGVDLPIIDLTIENSEPATTLKSKESPKKGNSFSPVLKSRHISFSHPNTTGKMNKPRSKSSKRSQTPKRILSSKKTESQISIGNSCEAFGMKDLTETKCHNTHRPRVKHKTLIEKEIGELLKGTYFEEGSPKSEEKSSYFSHGGMGEKEEGERNIRAQISKTVQCEVDDLQYSYCSKPEVRREMYKTESSRSKYNNGNNGQNMPITARVVYTPGSYSTTHRNRQNLTSTNSAKWHPNEQRRNQNLGPKDKFSDNIRKSELLLKRRKNNYSEHKTNMNDSNSVNKNVLKYVNKNPKGIKKNNLDVSKGTDRKLMDESRDQSRSRKCFSNLNASGQGPSRSLSASKAQFKSLFSNSSTKLMQLSYNYGAIDHDLTKCRTPQATMPNSRDRNISTIYIDFNLFQSKRDTNRPKNKSKDWGVLGDQSDKCSYIYIYIYIVQEEKHKVEREKENAYIRRERMKILALVSSICRNILDVGEQEESERRFKEH